MLVYNVRVSSTSGAQTRMNRFQLHAFSFIASSELLSCGTTICTLNSSPQAHCGNPVVKLSNLTQLYLPAAFQSCDLPSELAQHRAQNNYSPLCSDFSLDHIPDSPHPWLGFVPTWAGWFKPLTFISSSLEARNPRLRCQQD